MKAKVEEVEVYFVMNYSSIVIIFFYEFELSLIEILKKFDSFQLVLSLQNYFFVIFLEECLYEEFIKEYFNYLEEEYT